MSDLERASKTAGHLQTIGQFVVFLVVTVGTIWGVMRGQTASQIKEALRPVFAEIDRAAVDRNMLLCAIKELGPLDCDPYEGIPRRLP